MSELLRALCWCAETEVLIPVEFVREGRTTACGRTGCLPGCELSEDDHTEIDINKPRRLRMNRFRPTGYDPRSDSSDVPQVVSEAHPDSLVLFGGPGICPCGCGETPRGKGATFGMGHDIRFRGKLIRAEASGATIQYVTPGFDVIAAAHAPLELASFYSTPKLDWEKSVRAGAERITEREAKRKNSDAGDRQVLAKAVGPQVGDTELIKVGRWEKTGTVVAVYRSAIGSDELEYEYTDAKGALHRVRRNAEGKLAEVER